MNGHERIELCRPLLKIPWRLIVQSLEVHGLLRPCVMPAFITLRQEPRQQRAEQRSRMHPSIPPVFRNAAFQ